MRAAAVIAGTIIVLGIFLTIAAASSMDATWIWIGMLTVSVAGSVGVMLASGPGGRGRVAAGG
jgi:hypothetical protein